MDLQIKLSSTEKAIFDKVNESASQLGIQVFAIGGFVRDKLLGRPCQDIDFVSETKGIDLAESMAKSLGKGAQVHVFKTFGTAMLKFGDIELEFVSARKESYNFNSRNPTVSEGTLEDDQKRRDFTINAMAVSTLHDQGNCNIIDPFGGLDDLQNGIIKTPLDPDATFSDDPLRILRAIRFCSQLGFKMDTETQSSLAKNRDRILIISQERISSELNKIMHSNRPSVGWLLLEQCGLLSMILPELSDLKGVEYKDGIGHKDNFFHTLEVIDNVAKESQDIWLRWAALFHDIAKVQTKRFEDGGWTFHGHEIVGANMLPRIFKRLKFPLDGKIHFVQNLVRLHLRPISLTKENITDAAIRRLLFDAGDDIEELMILCKADITSKNKQKKSRFLENYALVESKMIEIESQDRIRNWQPPIDGNYIMAYFGLKPCKSVGIIKNAIKDAILDGHIGNNPVEAHDFMLKLSENMGIQTKVTS